LYGIVIFIKWKKNTSAINVKKKNYALDSMNLRKRVTERLVIIARNVGKIETDLKKTLKNYIESTRKFALLVVCPKNAHMIIYAINV
jgi:hypothetical protein